MKLDLASLVDLEVRLARDQSLSSSELVERDAKLRTDATSSAVALTRWLNGVYANGSRPSIPFQKILRSVHTLASISGVLLGIGTAAALLRYDGTHPINIVNAIAVLVGAQIAILVFLLIHLGSRGVRSPVHVFLRDLLWSRAGLPQHAFRTIVPGVETALLLRVTQSFGIAFNVGALIAASYLVGVTDLAFAWSTTLDIGAERFKVLTDTLCAPWSIIWNAGCPDAKMIEATQYFRQGARYALGKFPDPSLVGAWWRFLIPCIVVYGLLPRIVVWTWAQSRLHVGLKHPRLDTAEVQSLLRRLTSPTPRGSSARLEAATPRRAWSKVAAIGWRDLPLDDQALIREVSRRFDAETTFMFRAGGTHGNLDGAPRENGEKAPASLIFVELWADFDKALRHFTSGIRKARGPDHPIIIVPIETRAGSANAETKIDQWRSDVARENDPYLGVAIGGVT